MVGWRRGGAGRGAEAFEVEKSGSLLAWTGFMSFPRQRPSNPMTAKLQSGVLRNHFRFVLQNKSLLFFFKVSYTQVGKTYSHGAFQRYKSQSA